MVIKSDLIKECQVCFRNFFNLNIHHINGNHDENRINNLINVCDDCHASIHNKINKRRIRTYLNDSDDEIIKKIYCLRIKLHKGIYGHTKFIPKDIITKRIKIITLFEKLVKIWQQDKIIEINYR